MTRQELGNDFINNINIHRPSGGSRIWNGGILLKYITTYSMLISYDVATQAQLWTIDLKSLAKKEKKNTKNAVGGHLVAAYVLCLVMATHCYFLGTNPQVLLSLSNVETKYLGIVARVLKKVCYVIGKIIHSMKQLL